jgi:uncharacterized protein YndB with AHSA1/START domain
MTDSLRIVRTLPVPRERVYRAWTDAAELARWYSPADGMALSIDAVDVRPGGGYQATFGRPGDVPFVESGEYRRVVASRLLEFDVTIARGGRVLSRTRCTVELLDAGDGTQLVLTDEGEGAGEHASGWGPALEHLAQLLANRPPTK